MTIISLRNVGPQTGEPGATVNLGVVYRRFVPSSCGFNPITYTDNSVTVVRKGIYNVDLNAVVSSTVAGNVELQMNQDAVAIPSASATETITTATTEFRTIHIQTSILIDNDNLLGYNTVVPTTITVTNTGTIPVVITDLDTRFVKVV